MSHLRPDFVIVGAKTLFDGQHGVHLMASNRVDWTDLDIEFDTLSLMDWAEPHQPHGMLRARLRSIAMVYASDYRTAWEHLMKMGNPDSGNSPWRQGGEIVPAPRQLPPDT